MASNTPSPKQQLERVREAIALIERKTKPLFEEMRKEWFEVEKSRVAYSKVKARLMPKIAEIEGRRDGGSDLFDLKKQEVQLLQAGAHRT